MTEKSATPKPAPADPELEEALDEAEDRFYTVFNVNPAPALIVRLFDERIELVNSGFAELLGYERGELKGKLLHEFDFFVDLQVREELLGEPRHSRTVTKLELTLQTQSGDPKTVLASAKPIEFNDQTCAILTFADITEQKQAEEHFAAMFRIAPAPAGIIDLGTGRFTGVNERFYEFCGCNAADVLNRTGLELGLWSSPPPEPLRAALAGRESFRELELEFCTKSGDVRDVSASAELFGGGELLLMFHDVTQRRQTERQLSQAIGEVMRDAQLFSQLIMERLTQLKTQRSGEPASASLSPREREVLQCVAKGLGNDAIAAELGLAAPTVRNYISAIYTKLEVRSRAEAVVWARERGLGGP